MIRALLPIAAMLSLVTAYHAPIPKITKEVDGTKINVNIAIDTKTGDSVDTERSQLPVVVTQNPSQVAYRSLDLGDVPLSRLHYTTATCGALLFPEK